jgi:hypothetical protein
LNDIQQCFFCPGNSTDLSNGILLKDLSATFQHLMDTGQLFCSHAKFHRVYNAGTQVQLKECVLRQLSAHGLSSLVAPTSLKSHTTMPSTDKSIWDAAYLEESDGLASLPTWEAITEAHFKTSNKGVKALPSMAIATIKYDSFNRPKRAKYRIVVLGNHDYHTWSKEATTAPVLLQLELRLLTLLAIHHKHYLKNCDIKQAFVQSSLPADEHYFIKPPAGCIHSTPGTYWRLLRSLYGLKRAPKLWYKTLAAHLRSMGLRQSTTSPCLFVGTLIEGGSFDIRWHLCGRYNLYQPK